MMNLEPDKSNGASCAGRVFTWRLVVTACLVVLAVIVLLALHFLWPGPSVDAQLRAIDAAHAVPDEQNAGKDYTLLLLNGAGTFLDPQSLPMNLWTATLAQAWRGTDFPEAAKWIKEREPVIDALLQAGRKPLCWFPLDDPQRQSGKRFAVAHYGSLLLVRAANNDFGEGRMDAGLKKLLCVFQVAEHFRSQMTWTDRYAGMAVASEGFKCLNRLLVTEDVPPEWLTKLEAALPPIGDTADKDFRRLDEVEDLRARKYLSFRDRMLYTLTGGTSDKQMRWIDSAHLSEFRAGRILLALRRHKDRTGAWPATLAEIEGQIPPEALIDPLTKKPFIYRPTWDSLILYNVGPNGIDEGGTSGDDYHFWPPSERWPGSVKYR